MGLFRSVLKLTEDVVEVATAPVRLTIDTTRVVTKPVAEMAKATADAVEEMADDVAEGMKMGND